MSANWVLQFRIRIILFAAMILLGVCSLILTQHIDTVVHNDLYLSGLQFDNNWANIYWSNLHLLLGFLTIAFCFIIISLVTFVSYVKRSLVFLKYVSFSLLIIAMCLNIGAIYFFNVLDQIVNVDLYLYGLTFESSWALSYWSYTIFLLLSLGASIILAVITSVLLIVSTRTSTKLSYRNMIPIILTALGFLALGLSIVYDLSILAFVGLGLIFWGILFTYIRTEKYVKSTLFDLTSASQLTTLNHMIRQLDFQGGIFYLPPCYSNVGDFQKAFLPKMKNSIFPLPTQTKEGQTPLIELTSGLLLVPPGAKLATNFEHIIKTNFSNLELKDLQKIFSKLLINKLEIAKTVEVSIEPNKIHIILKNSMVKAPISEFDLKSAKYSRFGSPLSSALACVLSKVTNKIVFIEKEENVRNDEDLLIEYSLISSGA